MTNNSNANGKPFDGNIDSARSYMLKLLEEKYSEEFQIVGDEDLTDYPAHGAVYDCYVAPTSDSNKIFSALVDQSKPNEVLDNFAMYFFKEEAEPAAIALCENKEYITAYRIKFITPATEKKWSSQDSLQAFLSENNSKVEIYACLEDSKTDKEYAEMIADFTKDIYSSSIDTTLKFVNNERYIFFQDFLVVGETKTPTLTNSEILASIDSAKQIRFKKQDDLIIK